MKKQFITLWLLCVTTAICAQTDFLSQTEKKCYLLHTDEINARSEIAKEDKFLELITTYNIKLVYETELKSICEMQEMRKVICDYLQANDHKKRFELKQWIDNSYRNAIDRIIILSGNDVSSPSMAVVFSFADYLKLTPGQTDTLVAGAINFKQILKKDPRKNMWKQELELLQNTLNENQLERFLDQKNSNTALRNAKTHWNRLRENGLTNDLDSVQSVNQMYAHILKKQRVSDLYFDNETLKREAWTAIDRYAPLAMNRSYAISKKNTTKRQSYRGTFNW